jgi:hypothetical protein
MKGKRMKGTFTKKALGRTVLLSGTTLILGFAGSAFAAYVQQHESIVLKNPAGTPITSMNGAGNAFSMKTTCFGTAGCHGTGTTGKLQYNYNDIERHSYHAQLGANEIRGFNPYNPDSTDKWSTGAGPQGKNWVQSPGHVGSW